MSIYVIGDLHLSFNNPKPMSIFGDMWQNHEQKIEENWVSKVKEDDTVLLLGDFSWEMNLKDTKMDFEYLNNLPGKKIMLKGNHDFWWTSVKKNYEFLKENNIKNVSFLQNDSIKVENKIICGTRGWALTNSDTENSKKIMAREAIRLELSIKDALSKRENNEELIACMHYPPISNLDIIQNQMSEFCKILKKYEIKKCYYGHLHGNSIKEAVNGNVWGIDFKLVSADGINFDLVKIED